MHGWQVCFEYFRGLGMYVAKLANSCSINLFKLVNGSSSINVLSAGINIERRIKVNDES